MAVEPKRLAVRVADASDEHVEAIAAVYAAVVESSHATFDVEPLSAGRWAEIVATSDPARGHYVLVALDPEGRVAGYAKSGVWLTKPAYASTCETSIHIAEDARGAGVGTALYSVLIERLVSSPLRLAVAGLAEPNEASAALHRRFGFRPVGTFAGVGVKFGRSWDVTWYQRALV